MNYIHMLLNSIYLTASAISVFCKETHQAVNRSSTSM